MTGPDPETVESVRGLSREMLAAAEAERWEDLAELEQRRRPLVHEAFDETPEEPEAARAVAAAIQEIMAIDQRVAELAGQARDSIAGELRGLSKGRQAARAYGNTNTGR